MRNLPAYVRRAVAGDPLEQARRLFLVFALVMAAGTALVLIMAGSSVLGLRALGLLALALVVSSWLYQYSRSNSWSLWWPVELLALFVIAMGPDEPLESTAFLYGHLFFRSIHSPGLPSLRAAIMSTAALLAAEIFSPDRAKVGPIDAFILLQIPGFLLTSGILGTLSSSLTRERKVHEENRKLQQQLVHQALHDALTELPNRTLLYDRLAQAMLLASRNASSVAVLLMDLDGFKQVNDSHGHACGDKLLQKVASRLTAILRQSDTVARLGGDEFCLLLPGLSRGPDVPVAAAKILASFEEPFLVDGLELRVGTSLGFAFFPEHGEDIQTMMRRADSAMYQAKRRGGGYAVYGMPIVERPSHREVERRSSAEQTASPGS